MGGRDAAYLSVCGNDDLSQVVVHGSHCLAHTVQSHVNLPFHSVAVRKQTHQLHHNLGKRHIVTHPYGHFLENNALKFLYNKSGSSAQGLHYSNAASLRYQIITWALVIWRFQLHLSKWTHTDQLLWLCFTFSHTLKFPNTDPCNTFEFKPLEPSIYPFTCAWDDHGGGLSFKSSGSVSFLTNCCPHLYLMLHNKYFNELEKLSIIKS